MKFLFDTRFLRLGLLMLLVLLPACDAKRTAKSGSNGRDRVTLMLNWYPESEHGGFYAAKVHGIFKKYGLGVELRPGGPNAPVAQELVTGRVEFAIGNADDVLLFRQQETHVVALMATIQNTPRCILVNRESGVEDLEDLRGMTLQANVGRAFLDYMRRQGLLDDVRVVPYSGSVSSLVADPKTAIQAYSFAEPLMAKEQGIEVDLLMLSEIGFNPYATCLIATEDYLAEHEDIARRMVQACREGWQQYLSDPDETNRAILEANQHGMTADALKYGVAEMHALVVPEGKTPEDIGEMRHQRWSELIEQLSELELIDSDKVKADEVFTTRFLQTSPAAP